MSERVEQPAQTMEEIIAQNGYIILPVLMRFLGFERSIQADIYDAYDDFPYHPGLETQFLGLMDQAIEDPFDSARNRRVGRYLIYDPKRVSVGTDSDFHYHQRYPLEHGWAPLDAPGFGRSINPKAREPGQYYIKRIPKSDARLEFLAVEG